MPNWCSCSLTLEGNKTELEKFKKKAAGKDIYGEKKILCEDNFIPYPKEYADMDIKRAKMTDEYTKLTEEEKKEWKRKHDGKVPFE